MYELVKWTVVNDDHTNRRGCPLGSKDWRHRRRKRGRTQQDSTNETISDHLECRTKAKTYRLPLAKAPTGIHSTRASGAITSGVLFLHDVTTPGELLWDDNLAMRVNVQLFSVDLVRTIDWEDPNDEGGQRKEYVERRKFHVEKLSGTSRLVWIGPMDDNGTCRIPRLLGETTIGKQPLRRLRGGFIVCRGL